MNSNRIPKPIKIKGGEYLLSRTYAQCKSCDYKVTSEKALRLHLKYSHNKKLKKLDKEDKNMFYCRVCDLTVYSEKDMIDHSKRAHR